MNEQVLLQELEIVLSSGRKSNVSDDNLRKILAHVKNLERCLADALRLAHGRKRKRVAA